MVTPRSVSVGLCVVSRSMASTALSPVTGKKLKPAELTVCACAVEGVLKLPATSLALAVKLCAPGARA